jgi:hypothetical protein
LPIDVTVKIPVPAGTVNGPGTIVGAVTTVDAGGRLGAAGASYVGAVVAFVVGAVVGAVVWAVVFGAVVAGVLVFAVVGDVVALVVAVVDFGVAVVVTFAVVTVVAADAVVPSGAGTVASDETAAVPVVSAAATETGKIMPPARAAMSRPMTSRRTPRIFERYIHTIGEYRS